MAITVEINSVDQSARVVDKSIRITWKLGNRASGSLRIKDVTGVTYRPAIGHEVRVLDGGTAIFGGSIDEFTEFMPGEPPALFFDCSLVGYEQRLDKRVTNAIAYGRAPFTTNSISDLFTFSESNPFENDYAVMARTTGTLPSPLNSTTIYYVINRTATTCQLSASPGGASINLLDDGTGDHHLIWCAGSVVKSVRAIFGAAESLTLGTINDGVGIELGTFEWSRASEIIEHVASVSNLVWYVDALKRIQFIPRTAFTAPFNVGDSSPDVLRDSYFFRYTREEYANDIRFRISEEAFASTIVDFNGDGAKRKFQTSTVIKSVSFVSVAGTEKTFGILGVDTGKDWYYTPGDRWIYQDAGGSTLGAGVNLHIRYRAFGFDAMNAEDTAEQATRAGIEGGSGIYSKVLQNDGIMSQDAGQVAADAALVEAKVIPVEFRYRCKTGGLLPGQLQTVNLTAHAVNGTFLIDEVTASDQDHGLLFYDVRALSSTRLGDYLTVFKSFVGGGGGGGASVSGGGAGGVGGAATPHEVTLPDGPGTTSIVSPIAPSNGAILSVKIAQSAVGNRQITWDANFLTGTTVDIQKSPTSVTIMTFMGFSDGKWHLIAPPTRPDFQA